MKLNKRERKALEFAERNAPWAQHYAAFPAGVRRMTLDGLVRKGLLRMEGGSSRTDPHYYAITDAGREALED